MTEPIGVLVCGTNYGMAYVRAISARPEVFRLRALLAKGSPRSVELSHLHGVPLYRSVEELPAGNAIDMACVAVPAGNRGLLLGLLERGIHVLCEHPQPPDVLHAVLSEAHRRNIGFHVNAHFGELAEPAAFVACSQHLAKTSRPLCIDIIVQDRMVYAGLDVLRRAVGSLAPWELKKVSDDPAFAFFRGMLCGVPSSISIQARGFSGTALGEASPEYVTDLECSIRFPGATLELPSVSGPTIWKRVAGGGRRDGAEPLWRIVGHAKSWSSDRYGQDRVAANLSAMDALVRTARGAPPPPCQSSEHLLDVSECASELIDFRG